MAILKVEPPPIEPIVLEDGIVVVAAVAASAAS
jgi:hypothetical protein